MSVASRLRVRVLIGAALVAPVAAVAAQGTITIPSDAIGRDGLGLGHLAGLSQPRRQQFLLGEGLLAGLRGRTITRITFRRDGQPADLTDGAANLIVRLDQQTVSNPWRASPVFAVNLGANTAIVFQGQVDAPASPRPLRRDGVGFGAGESVSIALANPFLYVGGTLCIDIEGAPVVGNTTGAWPIDIERDAVRGHVTTTGTSCVSTPERVTRHVSADPSALRPGATARFVGFGGAGQPAGLLVAAQRLRSPVDLGFLGSPGCKLGLVPMLDLWTSTAANPRGPLSAANVYLTMPHEAHFVSATLHAQWVFVQDGGIRTTETMTADFAGSLASIDGAIVTSRPQAGAQVGEVEVSAVPAVQFAWQ